MKNPVRRLLQWSFTTLLLTPAVASAGWSSLGGETLKDKINPWFLQNTQQVRYCILHDTQNFGQSLDDIRRRVRKSIQIWKHQLRNLKMDAFGGISENINLGTQEFIEISCTIVGDEVKTSDADLVLQFGVLSGEQLRRLGDPTKFIGVTVRTEYDPVNLKAKGFMYFSPESGPLKLNKVGLKQNPWSSRNGKNLLFALLHEFGHVFGIQHSDFFFLMKENLLEELLTPWPGDSDEGNDDLLPGEKEEGDVFLLLNFFKFESFENFPIYSFCTASSSRSDGGTTSPPQDYLNLARAWIEKFLNKGQKRQIKIEKNPFDDFFGIKSDQNQTLSHCFELKRQGQTYTLEVIKKYEDNKTQVIGRAKYLARHESSIDERSLVSLWLPKEQKVFKFSYSPNSFTERKISIGSMQYQSLFKGTYQIIGTAIQRPLFIHAGNFHQHRYGGELDGVYYQDLHEGF